MVLAKVSFIFIFYLKTTLVNAVTNRGEGLLHRRALQRGSFVITTYREGSLIRRHLDSEQASQARQSDLANMHETVV